MKRICLVFTIVFCGIIANAQQVKLYLATVKTKTGTIKGILQKVDSASLTISSNTGLINIHTEDIKMIKIRNPKKHSDLIQFIKYDPWSDGNFEMQNGLKVRKWGEKDPTLGEEIGGNVATTFINITGNLIAAPIQSINPSIANYKINGSAEKFDQNRNELTYFSVYYQLNPDLVTELKKVKELSASFKP